MIIVKMQDMRHNIYLHSREKIYVSLVDQKIMSLNANHTGNTQLN